MLHCWLDLWIDHTEYVRQPGNEAGGSQTSRSHHLGSRHRLRRRTERGMIPAQAVLERFYAAEEA